MDKNTLSNYGWIVIAVLVLSVMIALATPFGNYIKTATESTLDGLISVNDNALAAGINGILGKEKIEVDGLGEITVKNPYGAEFEYDKETGILTGTTPITPVDPENLENVIPMIEFTAGVFESNTKYNPGQYELESYEVTKTRSRKPVPYSFGMLVTWHYDKPNGTLQPYEIPLTMVEHHSTYLVYNRSLGGTTANGKSGSALHYYPIDNAKDDTLENAIYLAAYIKKTANGIWDVAKWDGIKYVDANCRVEIDAITDFTETYTETVSKPVTITKPSSSTTLVYIPSGTMKAEKGMTWAEWLASEYNTFGAEATKVWDANYNEVALDSKIVAGGSYGFSVIKKESNWPITWNMAEISNNTSVGGMVYKISNIIPDVFKDEVKLTCGTQIESPLFKAVCAGCLKDGTIQIAVCGDEGGQYVLYIFAVPEAGATSEILGVTFPEAGLYVMDMAGNLLGQDINLTLCDGEKIHTDTIKDSWDEIKAHIDAGDYATRYKIGDTKIVTLTNGVDVVMEIAAFNADTKIDGTKTAITWITKHAVFQKVMNFNSSNSGGWKDSELRAWLQNDLYNLLPKEVKNAISSVNKTYYIYGNNTILSCTDTIWLPSYREVYGYSDLETSGVTYTDYFTGSGDDVKYMYYKFGTTSWWLRSGGSNGKESFRCVSSDGGSFNTASDSQSGVVFGFCM